MLWLSAEATMCGADEADVKTGVRPLTSAAEATITRGLWP